jgi:CO/xanthine dehydrogenase Mo-binding subunit
LNEPPLPVKEIPDFSPFLHVTEAGSVADSYQVIETTASVFDYRMPTSLDLPMIDTVLVEVANPRHRYGVRGVGEVPIVPPPAALANAI